MGQVILPEFTSNKFIKNILPKPADNRSFIEKLADISKTDPDEYERILDQLESKFGEEGLKNIKYNWDLMARPNQIAPQPESGEQAWGTWVISAGRGFGKTRVGAEMVRRWAEEGGEGTRIALVGRTTADVSHTMINGDSGILAVCPPWDRPHHSIVNRTLTWKNGAIAETYTAETPDLLRGPQQHKAWCDELASWRYESAWSNLMFGLRLGDNPQAVVTTTPRPIPILLKVLAQKDTWTTVASSQENRANLAKKFFTEIIEQYKGTSLYSQEIDAEIMDRIPNAMWDEKNIEDNRVTFEDVEEGRLPDFLMTVLAIDPATTTRKTSAETGMCVMSYGSDDHFYVQYLDATKEEPEQWASRALKLFEKYRCDKLIAEVNNGGDLVRAVINSINPNMTVTPVHASRGKVTRAEPIAALYVKNRFHHIGTFASGEQQMISFNPTLNPYGLKDQIDALVWAGTWLVDQTQGKSTYAPAIGGVRAKMVGYRYR